MLSKRPSRRILGERIAHERELRQVESRAVEHERELRELGDARERELRTVAEGAVEKARAIQFSEYERRLADLNNSHERALEAAALTVPRETYDTYVRETGKAADLARQNVELALEKRDAEIDRRLSPVERAGQRLGGASDLGRWFAPNLTSLLQLVTLLVLGYLALHVGGTPVP